MTPILLFLLLSLMPSIQQKTPPIENRLIGTWHGTSLCVDRTTDTACKDEVVIYIVKGIPSVRDTVAMEAFKIIKGERISMGMLFLEYSPAIDSWTFELRSRSRALWTFQANDSTMSGMLMELPSRRLIRRVDAGRIAE